MNNLILISGSLAVGKSTLAKSLGEQLSYIVINKDELKEIACDIFDYTNREENLKLSKASMKYMIHFFERCAKAGKDVILEANFRTEEVCDIADIAEENDYRVCLILLTGDDELLYERFLSRVPGRHKAHLSIGLQSSFEKYKEYNEMLANQDLVYEPHIIDITSLNPEDVLSTTLMILKEEDMI